MPYQKLWFIRRHKIVCYFLFYCCKSYIIYKYICGNIISVYNQTWINFIICVILLITISDYCLSYNEKQILHRYIFASAYKCLPFFYGSRENYEHVWEINLSFCFYWRKGKCSKLEELKTNFFMRNRKWNHKVYWPYTLISLSYIYISLFHFILESEYNGYICYTYPIVYQYYWVNLFEKSPGLHFICDNFMNFVPTYITPL